jgi:hypothetical protein
MFGGNGMENRTTRRALSHSLIVDVQVIDLESGIHIRECTKDLNLYGCDVSTATPFAAGTKVVLKSANETENFTAFGKVIHGRRDIGMRIAFTIIEPEDQKLLEDWITGLAMPKSQS